MSTTITGNPIEALTPGSTAWMQTISASKVPAILGISPWQSKYALWHLMAGNTEPWAGNKSTERGTFLEAAVLNWFKAQHPEMEVSGGASFAHHEHPDWTAAPDGTALDDNGEDCGIELKTSQYSDGYGTPGTAEIPPYYLAQAAWQMIVCGFRRVYVPVLFGQPFEFREYVVNWEDVEADIPLIIRAVEAFQQSLADCVEPDIDGSSATYQTIKELHPDIDGEVIDLPTELAVEFIGAKQVADAASAVMDEYKNRIADYMGNAKKAVWNKQPLFSRQSKGGGTPYLVIARTLPTITEKSAAA